MQKEKKGGEGGESESSVRTWYVGVVKGPGSNQANFTESSVYIGPTMKSMMFNSPGVEGAGPETSSPRGVWKDYLLT